MSTASATAGRNGKNPRQSRIAEAAATGSRGTHHRPRAAACTTVIYTTSSPSEDERFQCSAGLGALTREQILEKGWKVDFVEKIPPPSNQPAQSPRGCRYICKAGDLALRRVKKRDCPAHR